MCTTILLTKKHIYEVISLKIIFNLIFFYIAIMHKLILHIIHNIGNIQYQENNSSYMFCYIEIHTQL